MMSDSDTLLLISTSKMAAKRASERPCRSSTNCSSAIRSPYMRPIELPRESVTQEANKHKKRAADI